MRSGNATAVARGLVAVQLAVMTFGAKTAIAGPVIFWQSDPISPGQTALVTGSDFTGTKTVRMHRVEDTPEGRRVAAKTIEVGTLSTSDHAIAFEIPASFSPGVFEYEIVGAMGHVSGLLNAPSV